jgi:hypothetical protein
MENLPSTDDCKWAIDNWKPAIGKSHVRLPSAYI